MVRPGFLSPGVLPGLLLVLGCAAYEVALPAEVSFDPPQGFVAGFAKRDLTPPPGAPLFGYSLEARSARGFRHRLWARAAYLAHPGGERAAVVAVDLGAVSSVLHAEVVARLEPALGLGRDRVLIAATHTHAGPGACFDCSYYNHFGSASPGFDGRLLAHLANGIAAAITEAAARATGPATLATATGELLELTHNRSREAYLRNPEAQEPGSLDRDPRVTVIRVQAEGGRELGAIGIFAIHGTVLGSEVDLYHGDVLGAAARAWERRGGEDGFVAVLLNGNEGDLRPDRPESPAGEGGAPPPRLDRSFARAHALGVRLGEALHTVQLRAGPASAMPDLAVRGRELLVPDEDHAAWVQGFCAQALTGEPVLGGSEEGGPGGGGLREGRRRESPQGCQGVKLPALGLLQDLLLDRDAYPRRLQGQVLQVGDLLLLAVPAEMTTTAGARLARAAARAAARAGILVRDAVVLGLANGFVSYVTTPEEYDAQHYEGGATLYGPGSLAAWIRHFEDLVPDLARPAPGPAGAEGRRFSVGLRASFVPAGDSGARIRAGPLRLRPGPEGTWVAEFEAGGPAPYLECRPWIRVRDVATGSILATDLGCEIEVRRELWVPRGGYARWTARWHPEAPPRGPFRVEILDLAGAAVQVGELAPEDGP
jgi:neutral ceramidase